MTSLMSVLAHPGHGQPDVSAWRHYLTEPVHVIAAAALVVFAGVVWWRYRRQANNASSPER